MIGALWTGISGLSSHQTALDNESHNISNVNTIGYKSSRISFADQMYQDKIGKGSKVLDAEKLYVQGNLKLTGVNYDMALSGGGFFTVRNTRSSGSSENLYTRAGNFRMGDNGTLQDAAGNEVQGWVMRAIDTKSDVVSTNPNVKRFTSDYTKLLTSKIVKHSNYIETITVKATDYNQTTKSDSLTIFSGAGGKTKSAKISDIEALVGNYTSWLQKLQDKPDGGSASSIAQISQINFKSYNQLAATGRTDSGLISKDGDQIYVYIDGTRYSQNYVAVSASKDLDGDGIKNATDDKIASRIATYKALANKISEIPGLRAYMVAEDPTKTKDVLESEQYTLSTKNADMVKGIIQIESLIPGKSFSITEVGEVSGQNKLAGNFQTSTLASAGEGVGALKSARDALARAITGNQQDVYTPADLKLAGTIPYQYSMTIYDKELNKVIPVPNDNGTPPSAVPITIDPTNGTGVASIDNFIANFKTQAASSSPNLLDYIDLKNINGNLVIQTKDTNYDVEFNGSLKSNTKTALTSSNTTGSTFANSVSTPDGAKDYVYTYKLSNGTVGHVTITNPADWNAIASAINSDTNLTASYNTPTANTLTITGTGAPTIVSGTLYEVATEVVPYDKNSDYSGRQGGGAEFLQLVNTIDQTTTQSSLQLKLDTLGISSSAFGEFSVDSTGLITMKQDGAEFAIGQISIALFNNTRGLNPVGDNLLSKTNESGEPIYNLNNDKTAKVEGKTLELSTADLSESLVNLMVFQRAFEANAKSITTSDQLLNTLINLKR